jgi:hypothetical protein
MVVALVVAISFAAELPSAEVDALLETAEAHLGAPYVYGDTGEYGFDCSGFVRTVFARHGYQLPRTSSLQSTVGEPVDFDALQPGDLIFFNPSPSSTRISHVGIILPGDRMIHASSGRGEVVIDQLGGRYWRRRRAEARRVLGSPFGTLGTPEMHAPGLREHDSPPALTLGSAAKPSLWHHGPLRLRPERSALGLATAWYSTGGEYLYIVQPRAELRIHSWDATTALQLPLAWDESGNSALPFDKPEAWLRLIERFRVGTPNARAHLELSRELSVTLGDSMLVSGHTAMASHKGLPDIPLHGGLGLATHYRGRQGKVEFVLDDIVAPALMGFGLSGKGRFRPVGELALDPNSASRTIAGAAGLELHLVDARHFDWVLRARALSQRISETTVGGSAGATFSLHSGSSRIELSADWAAFESGFAPSLFGVNYRYLRRSQFLDRLTADASNGGWITGPRLAASWSLTRRFGARLRAATYRTPDSNTPLDELEVGVIARSIRLSDSLQAYFSVNYHQRFVGAWSSPGFSDTDSRELVFANAVLTHDSGIGLSASVARKPDTTSGARWDGSLTLSFDFIL